MGYFCILFIIITYLLLLVLDRIVEKNILITPETVFLFGFIAQLAYSLLYVNEWNLELSIDTIMVYIIGSFSFCFFSVIFRNMLLYKSKKDLFEEKESNSHYIVISKTKLILAAIFQLFAIVMMSRTLIQMTKAKNLASAINLYALLSKDRGFAVSQFVGKLNLFSYLSGFVWMYYLIHSIVYKYKNNRILIVLNLVLSFISNMLTGSRGGVIQVIITGLFCYYMLWEEKNNWRKRISTKSFIKIISLAIMVLIFFSASLKWLGRSTSVTSTNDYIGIYLSAEIKNLDIKIRDGCIKYTSIENWKTLNKLFSKVSSIFGWNVEKYYADASTYIMYNKKSLGNVYTIYYAFISDLGFFGLVFFGAIMAFVSQFIFAMALKKDKSIYTLNTYKLINAYILTMIFFSFFSNWFFDFIFSTGFIWCLITWVGLKLLLEWNKKIKWR